MTHTMPYCTEIFPLPIELMRMLRDGEKRA